MVYIRWYSSGTHEIQWMLPDGFDVFDWHHYTMTRSGTIVKLYVDGEHVDSITDFPADLADTTYNKIRIGSGFESGSAQTLGADIQNYQISSTVRYTNNFVPDQDTRQQIDTNTLVMFHAHGDLATHELVEERTGRSVTYEGGEQNIYYNFRDCDPCTIENRVIGGTLTLDDASPPRAAQQGVSPVALFDDDRSALWFDGSSQAITTAQNDVTIAQDADFTMEAWVYPLDYDNRGGYSPTLFNLSLIHI